MKSPKRTKNSIYGISMRIHENDLYPALHIRWSTHVENSIYAISAENTIKVLVTSHVYVPTQYLFVFPMFWIAIRTSVTILTIK